MCNLHGFHCISCVVIGCCGNRGSPEIFSGRSSVPEVYRWCSSPEVLQCYVFRKFIFRRFDSSKLCFTSTSASLSVFPFPQYLEIVYCIAFQSGEFTFACILFSCQIQFCITRVIGCATYCSLLSCCFSRVFFIGNGNIMEVFQNNTIGSSRSYYFLHYPLLFYKNNVVVRILESDHPLIFNGTMHLSFPATKCSLTSFSA